ncbi:MAG TPA: heavy metal-binding domain-containing protein [Polyangiaceae bacterium]|jgi:uncharacterized protein YbjQ (UPF0145 family)
MAFTSDLTIDEVLLIEEVGFEPVELVMGSSYFHIGWQPTLWNTNMELGDVTAMMTNARYLALERMVQHAVGASADGVVGVRLEVEREGHNAEFTVIGTAVRRRGDDRARWRQNGDRPFTCDLSGGDFWALVRAGFRPVAFAFGVCVYHVAHQSLGQWFSSVGQNCEMPQFTQGLYDARELAMGRMQASALAAGASAGLVGVSVDEGSHGWGHVIEMIAIGTGVAPIVDESHETHAPPRVILGAQDL